MDNNLDKAKRLLDSKNVTLALVGAREYAYISDLRGIAPMANFISEEKNLEGFCAADRVVGKAAAMLFILAKIKEVYAQVITHEAANLLISHGITVSYETIVDKIRNRAGTDICPMEKCVRDISDPREAFETIKDTLDRLSAGK